jgi:LacI family transcriptional regulator
VGDVVAEIPLSRRPLERRFRTVFGRTLLAEIHRVRVSEATRLLQQTELPIASVAKQVGFNGNDRLTEAFRTLLGTTPAAYRQSKHKNKS